MERVIFLIVAMIFASMLYFGALNVIVSLVIIGIIAQASVYIKRYNQRNEAG